MTAAEFRDQGYLQEANRQFFHPLGLALAVTINDNGTSELGPIWDFRHNPEGVIFTPEAINHEKTINVMQEQMKKALVRQEQFGYIIQPLF